MNSKFHFARDHIRRHPVPFISIIFVGLMNSCVSFLLPVSVGEFFRFHFHSGSSKGKLFEWLGLHIDDLEQFFLLFAILLLLKILFSYLEYLGTYRHGELFVKDIREKVFAAQISWNADRFFQRSYGRYLLRYSNDMKAIQNYFMKGVIGGIMNVLFLLTGIVILSQINLRLTLVVIVLLAVSVLVIYFLSAFQKPFIKASRANRSSLLAFVSKSFVSFRQIKEKESEKNVVRKFALRSENLFLSNMRSNRMESLLLAASPFLIFVMIGTLLWQMTLPYSGISAADALMMILMLLMMQGTLRRIFKVPAYVNKGKISLQKIIMLLGDKSVSRGAIALFQNRQTNS